MGSEVVLALLQLLQRSIIRQVYLHLVVVLVEQLTVLGGSRFRTLLRHLFGRLAPSRALDEERVGPFELYRSVSVEHERQNAFSIHVRRNLNAGDVEESWCEIDVLHDFFDSIKMKFNENVIDLKCYATYKLPASIPGPRSKNGTRTSNSNGKLFPLINPNWPR